MKIKKILPAILILSVLVFSGCSNYKSKIQKDEVPFMEECMDKDHEPYIVEGDSRVKEASDADICFNLLARQVDNYAYCGLIKLTQLKDECLFHFAVTKKDPNICYEIEGGEEQNCLMIVNLKPLDPDEAQYMEAGDYPI